MRVSQEGIDLIKAFEGCRLSAYKDAVGIPTIGWGLTRYPNGIKVAMFDQITQEEADRMLIQVVDQFAEKLKDLIIQPLKQQQFDALVSFAYNVGVGAFHQSTLRKKVNANPNDPTIKAEFLKWNKAGGKVLNGLTRRREKEAQLYFK